VIPRVVNYLGLGLIISVVLLDAGVELGPVLGAAGIVGLAIGIASQASLSNIISGFLLVSEKAFAVGDVVRIGTTTAVVESIDLLSVKMRTFDNLYIRFPNEKVATSELTNITRHPIRRLVLEEPEPIVLPLDYTEIGCKVLLGVWFSRTDFVTVKRDLYAAIPAALQARGIRFAVPVRVLRSDGEELSAHLLERSVPGEDRQG
jgi:small-conductance mechanosensitive channel